MEKDIFETLHQNVSIYFKLKVIHGKTFSLAKQITCILIDKKECNYL